jgi:DNA-directed RNA polymerase subunit RPC12/RpoP
VLLKNDREALAKMIEYCKKDVVLLEEVFKRLQGHTTHKTHYGVIFNQDRGSCPECGSDDLIRKRVRVTAAGTRYVQYRCKTCGTYHQKIDK